MTKKNITQEHLKYLFSYDPLTGLFTRNIDVGRPGKVKKGKVAGCLNKAHGYVNIIIDREIYLAHRLAWLYMTGSFPESQIDHINHIRNDNRWVNLRDVTHVENQQNKNVQKNNSSGVAGVHWDKRSKKWWARIGVNGKIVSLGYYKNKTDAVKARKEAEIKHGYHPNHGLKGV